MKKLLLLLTITAQITFGMDNKTMASIGLGTVFMAAVTYELGSSYSAKIEFDERTTCTKQWEDGAELIKKSFKLEETPKKVDLRALERQADNLLKENLHGVEKYDDKDSIFSNEKDYPEWTEWIEKTLIDIDNFNKKRFPAGRPPLFTNVSMFFGFAGLSFLLYGSHRYKSLKLKNL